MRRLESQRVFVTPEQLTSQLTALERRLDTEDVFVTQEELEEQTQAIDGLTPVASFSANTGGTIQRQDFRTPVTRITVTRAANGVYDVTWTGLPGT